MLLGDPRGLAAGGRRGIVAGRSEEHTSELQSLVNLVCRLLLEKKKNGYECPYFRGIASIFSIFKHRGFLYASDAVTPLIGAR